MGKSEMFISLGIGVVSGIVAGLITGIIITVYYRSKDSKEAWNRQLHDDNKICHVLLLRSETKLIY